MGENKPISIINTVKAPDLSPTSFREVNMSREFTTVSSSEKRAMFDLKTIDIEIRSLSEGEDNHWDSGDEQGGRVNAEESNTFYVEEPDSSEDEGDTRSDLARSHQRQRQSESATLKSESSTIDGSMTLNEDEAVGNGENEDLIGTGRANGSSVAVNGRCQDIDSRRGFCAQAEMEHPKSACLSDRLEDAVRASVTSGFGRGEEKEDTGKGEQLIGGKSGGVLLGSVARNGPERNAAASNVINCCDENRNSLVERGTTMLLHSGSAACETSFSKQKNDCAAPENNSGTSKKGRESAVQIGAPLGMHAGKEEFSLSVNTIDSNPTTSYPHHTFSNEQCATEGGRTVLRKAPLSGHSHMQSVISRGNEAQIDSSVNLEKEAAQGCHCKHCFPTAMNQTCGCPSHNSAFTMPIHNNPLHQSSIVIGDQDGNNRLGDRHILLCNSSCLDANNGNQYIQQHHNNDTSAPSNYVSSRLALSKSNLAVLTTSSSNNSPVALSSSTNSNAQITSADNRTTVASFANDTDNNAQPCYAAGRQNSYNHPCQTGHNNRHATQDNPFLSPLYSPVSHAANQKPLAPPQNHHCGCCRLKNQAFYSYNSPAGHSLNATSFRESHAFNPEVETAPQIVDFNQSHLHEAETLNHCQHHLKNNVDVSFEIPSNEALRQDYVQQCERNVPQNAFRSKSQFGNFPNGSHERSHLVSKSQRSGNLSHPVYYEAPLKSSQSAHSVDPGIPKQTHSAESLNYSNRQPPPGKPLRANTKEMAELEDEEVRRQRLAGSLSTASDPSDGSAGTSGSTSPEEPGMFGKASSGTSCAIKPKSGVKGSSKKNGKDKRSEFASVKTAGSDDEDHEEEGHKLLKADEKALNSVDKHIGELPKNCFQGKRLTAYGGRAPGPVNPDSLYEGIQYKCSYLGSTQLISTSRPNRTLRMQQAHEAVTRIKAPDGEFQPSVEVFLHISTEKLALVNMDNNESIIEHPLRTISYIADIANIIVIMARRIPAFNSNSTSNSPSSKSNQQTGTQEDAVGAEGPDVSGRRESLCSNPASVASSDDQSYVDGQYPDDLDAEGFSLKPNKIVCHILECDKAQLIAQSIGQSFHLAYLDFLKDNGIEDESTLELEYLDVLNSQELKGEDLMLFANKEASKDVTIFKQKGEITGVVVIESGWGSVVPTFVIANLSPTGPAARSGLLNVGDQLLAIDGTSVVGLSLANIQSKLKSLKSEQAVRLTIVQCPPTTTVLIKRPSLRYQLGFSVQNGTICSLMRGGIAERGGIRVGHRIIEINRQSVVAVPHDKIVEMLATSVGQLHMKTMPLPMFRLLTGQDIPTYF